MTAERQLGSYRHDVLEEVGIRVSTIYRESSAMVNNPARYFETMAFWLDRTPAILWQSAGYSERQADRMHDLAVRWFARSPSRTGAVLATYPAAPPSPEQPQIQDTLNPEIKPGFLGGPVVPSPEQEQQP